MNLTDRMRAKLAFEHVDAYKEASETDIQKYGSMVLKLPILIHTSGLAPALHFVSARSHKHQRIILDHLAQQVKLSNGAALLKKVRSADLATTRGMTREVQRCLFWYRTLVKAELRVDPTMDDKSPSILEDN